MPSSNRTPFDGPESDYFDAYSKRSHDIQQDLNPPSIQTLGNFHSKLALLYLLKNKELNQSKANIGGWTHNAIETVWQLLSRARREGRAVIVGKSIWGSQRTEVLRSWFKAYDINLRPSSTCHPDIVCIISAELLPSGTSEDFPTNVLIVAHQPYIANNGNAESGLLRCARNSVDGPNSGNSLCAILQMTDPIFPEIHPNPTADISLVWVDHFPRVLLPPLFTIEESEPSLLAGRRYNMVFFAGVTETELQTYSAQYPTVTFAPLLSNARISEAPSTGFSRQDVNLMSSSEICMAAYSTDFGETTGGVASFELMLIALQRGGCIIVLDSRTIVDDITRIFLYMERAVVVSTDDVEERARGANKDADIMTVPVRGVLSFLKLDEMKSRQRQSLPKDPFAVDLPLRWRQRMVEWWGKEIRGMPSIFLDLFPPVLGNKGPLPFCWTHAC